jgi:uncharacterized protein YqfA (UPF0365 family)
MNNRAAAIIAAVSLVLVPLIGLTATALAVHAWLRSLFYLTPVKFLRLLDLPFRGIWPSRLVDAYIAIRWAGIPATIDDVENVYVGNHQHITTSGDLVALVKQAMIEPKA